jgi:hypothetical protein
MEQPRIRVNVQYAVQRPIEREPDGAAVYVDHLEFELFDPDLVIDDLGALVAAVASAGQANHGDTIHVVADDADTVGKKLDGAELQHRTMIGGER